MQTSGIYAITNAINGRSYFGSAVNLRRRNREHFYRLRKGNHASIRLQRAWNKYGEASFSFKPLLLCDKENLLFYEQQVINSFNAVQDGYNTAPIAGSALGCRCSDATKEKISSAAKGHQRRLGCKHSNEAKAKMSQSCTGRVLSAETKLKISIAGRGRKCTEGARRKNADSNRGNKNALGSKRTEESLHKMRGNKNSLGNVHTLAARAKMCEAQRARQAREKLKRETCRLSA